MEPAYPAHLTKQVTLSDGTQVTLRPIRPSDADIEAAFVRNLSSEARYFRFMDTLRELSPSMLERFTHIDYHDHMAFIAVIAEQGREKEIGVARYYVDSPAAESCEFAIVVADEWQGKGLGSDLMQELMSAARARGCRMIRGEVLTSNHNMLQLMKWLGFECRYDPDNRSVMRVQKRLQ